MANTHYNDRTQAPASPFSAFAAPLAHLISAITNWNDVRVTRNALSRLNDRELNDIGLVRGDIEDVARR